MCDAKARIEAAINGAHLPLDKANRLLASNWSWNSLTDQEKQHLLNQATLAVIQAAHKSDPELEEARQILLRRPHSEWEGDLSYLRAGVESTIAQKLMEMFKQPQHLHGLH